MKDVFRLETLDFRCSVTCVVLISTCYDICFYQDAFLFVQILIYFVEL